MEEYDSAQDPERPLRRSNVAQGAPSAAALALMVLAIGLLVGFAMGWISFDSPWSANAENGPLYDEKLVTSLVDKASTAVVEINVATSFGVGQSGSGFLVDGGGHIVTNHHVVASGGDVSIRLQDGRTLTATRLGTSPADDLALLQVDPAEVSELGWLPLADSDRIKPGQMAIAIGSPFQNLNSVTVGVVSGVGRASTREIGRSRDDPIRRPLPDLVQTDAALNPGNSGGPLLNSDGEVIGVNSSVAIVSSVQIGVGFAVSSNTLRGILPDLMITGVLKRAYIGIKGLPAKDISGPLGLDTKRGVYIREVVEGSPAEAAELRGDTLGRGLGDVIVAVDGDQIDSMADVVSHLNTLRPGDPVTLTILRAGGPLEVKVVLGAWPDL